MARPTRGEAPSTPATVRLSPEEKARILTAAKINHQNVSQFARDALVTAADDCLEDRKPR